MSERKMPSVEDYPSNAIGSEKDADERPALRGRVKKKSSIFKSVRDEFVSEDADNMGSYILHDILFPALHDLINDICHGAIDAAFGGGGNYRPSRSRGRGGYISYNRYYDDRDDRRRRRRRDRDDDDDDYIVSRRNIDFSEFRFEYKDDAEDVLDMLCDRLEKYDEVTVAYFLDKIGKTVPGNWTVEDWGWTNLAGTKIRGSSRSGWYIDLPRAKEL